MNTFNPEDFGAFVAQAPERYPQIIPTRHYAQGLIDDMEKNGLAEAGALRLWRKRWVAHWPTFESWLAQELLPPAQKAG